MLSKIALPGIFTSVSLEKTLIPRSYRCATMVLGWLLTSTSRRARDWECKLSPLLQSNWARTSLEPTKVREMSPLFWSPVNIDDWELRSALGHKRHSHVV